MERILATIMQATFSSKLTSWKNFYMDLSTKEPYVPLNFRVCPRIPGCVLKALSSLYMASIALVLYCLLSVPKKMLSIRVLWLCTEKEGWLMVENYLLLF